MKTGEIIGKYPSVRPAHDKTGIDNIFVVCNETRKSAGGYSWRFIDDKQ